MRDPAVLRPGPAPDLETLEASQLTQTILASQLVHVRKAAENWRNGLLAMIGLVTTVTFVKGRESLEALPTIAQATIGLFLLAAISLASYGSWQAMKAAFGDPQPRRPDSTVVVWDYQDASAAIHSLRRARLSFFAALACLVVSIGLTWYWPTAVSIQVIAVVGGSPICGELVSANSAYLVLETHGASLRVPTSSLVSMAVATSCP